MSSTNIYAKKIINDPASVVSDAIDGLLLTGGFT